MFKLRQSEKELDEFLDLIEEQYKEPDIRKIVFSSENIQDIRKFLLHSNKFYAFENYILQLANEYYKKYENSTSLSKNELYRKNLLNDRIHDVLTL